MTSPSTKTPEEIAADVYVVPDCWPAQALAGKIRAYGDQRVQSALSEHKGREEAPTAFNRAVRAVWDRMGPVDARQLSFGQIEAAEQQQLEKARDFTRAAIEALKLKPGEILWLPSDHTGAPDYNSILDSILSEGKTD